MSLAPHAVTVDTTIDAPVARCFDLARSVEAHVRSAAATRERAVEGRTTGLLELGNEVTWQARHFGVTQRLTSRITRFDRPRMFQDRMVRGAFAALEHDHLFEPTETGGTRMTDVLRFRTPLGFLGWPVGRVVLVPYLRRFLRQRGRALKQMAESDAWRDLLVEK